MDNKVTFKKNNKNLTGEVKEIHGLRYVVESRGKVYDIYEDELTKDLTESKRCALVKETYRKKKELELWRTT